MTDPRPEPEYPRSDASEDVDGDTVVSTRRLRAAAREDLADGPDADDLESTVLSARRAAAVDDDEDDLEGTLVGSRRAARDPEAVEEFDQTEIGSRRRDAATGGVPPADVELDMTELSMRRRVADAADDVEVTEIGSRRRASAPEATGDADTMIGSRRRMAEADTVVGERGADGRGERVDTGALETTKIAGVVEPLRAAEARPTGVPETATFDEADDADDDQDDTVRVATRRANTMEPHEIVEPRRATIPDPQITKAPYRPRAVPESPVVRMAEVPRAPQAPADSARAEQQRRASSRRGLVGIIVTCVIVAAAALTGAGLLLLSLLGG